MIDQIIKLRDTNCPIKRIAVILGVSRNTVRRHLRAEQEARSIQVKQEVEASRNFGWKSRINWIGICEKRRQGYTAKQIYQDYQPDISYQRFCLHLRNSIGKSPEIAIRLQHNPGEKVQVDFCDGIPITDHRTGKQSKTQLFVGVLPFSSYCFGIFVENQKLPTFIRAHEAMWAYFGGVAPYVVIDNLKAGVVKAHRYDPELNPTYCDYANHTQFAVLPARPYTPRDKASVEANIGAIQRSFYQNVREKYFYSLRELNEHFRKFLDDFNRRVMPDHGVSRAERFVVEKQKLLPLATTGYEICEWREAKVHPDCCIQIGKCFYSVPYQYRGQTVRVKVTDHLISVFDQEVRSIACHQRSQRIGSVVSCESHYPERHMQSQSFDVRKALAKAKFVGPYTELLIDDLLSGPRPLRFLRRVQGIFRLLDQGIAPDSLEYAMGQAITFSKHHLAFIQSCAQQYQLTGGRLQACRPQRDPESIYIRGGYDV